MDIQKDKWYIVSHQDVEKGPYDTYKQAKDNCTDECYSPMYGEEVIDTFVIE